eukprot:COSAG02_NODE_521_length_20750_cov_10.721079_21_plen_68_part_00
MTSAAIDGHTELCAHECCTACWEMIALRADPDAADVPCPACTKCPFYYRASRTGPAIKWGGPVGSGP